MDESSAQCSGRSKNRISKLSRCRDCGLGEDGESAPVTAAKQLPKGYFKRRRAPRPFQHQNSVCGSPRGDANHRRSQSRRRTLSCSHFKQIEPNQLLNVQECGSDAAATHTTDRLDGQIEAGRGAGGLTLAAPTSASSTTTSTTTNDNRTAAATHHYCSNRNSKGEQRPKLTSSRRGRGRPSLMLDLVFSSRVFILYAVLLSHMLGLTLVQCQGNQTVQNPGARVNKTNGGKCAHERRFFTHYNSLHPITIHYIPLQTFSRLSNGKFSTFQAF